MSGQCRADPACSVQGGKCVEERLQIGFIDRTAASLRPTPLIIGSAHQLELLVCFNRQTMNLLRLEIKDRQVLPLRRIGPNLIEHGSAHRDDKRFVADAGINIVAIHFSERSEEHTSELQSRQYLVCRLLLEKKKKQ